MFRAPKVPGYNPDACEAKQVFVTSKDGTKVPMFLVHKKGLKLDGNNPTLLYGYGGFNVVQSPTFSAARWRCSSRASSTRTPTCAAAESAARRGTGGHQAEAERVRRLHRRGRVADRQQVRRRRSLRSRGSNGGLLVGAVLNQRPELFGVAIPQVGVMDMLRFHKFTIGWNWIADYGSSANPDEFKALYAYSPMHNIRRTGSTGDADHDRRPRRPRRAGALVQVRGHARGTGQDRQAAADQDRHQVHGASNLEKQLETTADIYAFIMQNMGVVPARLGTN